jgi:malonyl-CoA/methylmalonyl-CoA synthetase
MSGFSTEAPRNLALLFDEAFGRAEDRPVFRHQSGKVLLTYAGLRAGVARFANALGALGIEPGDRVTVQLEKSIASVMLYLAVLRAGAIYQPLNPAYTAAEVRYFIADAEPALVVCDPSRHSEFRALADGQGVHAIATLDGAGEGSLAALALRMDTYHPAVERNGDDLAALIYTSGTTGRSKGAMLSHDNLSSNALTLAHLWRLERSDVLVHALPIFHVHGLFVALGTAFLAGAEMIWLDRFDAETVIDAFSRATVFMGVPTFYTRLLSSPQLTRAACGGMRLFISGSAPLLAETHHAFAERTGHRILERYGMTEAGMIASNPYEGARVAGTVGFALPNVDIRVADANGHEVPRGEIGIIEINGPNVFQGYWRMPEKTRDEFRSDGYFITGDVGTMDGEGRLTIIGRAKDVIITGGLNVYPKEVEHVLDRMEMVVESAVFGVAHPDFGEAVVAAVVAKHPRPSEKLIIETASRELARFKLPKSVFFVNDLPRNAMGKVAKAELRARFADAFSRAATPPRREG